MVCFSDDRTGSLNLSLAQWCQAWSQNLSGSIESTDSATIRSGNLVKRLVGLIWVIWTARESHDEVPETDLAKRSQYLFQIVFAIGFARFGDTPNGLDFDRVACLDRWIRPRGIADEFVGGEQEVVFASSACGLDDSILVQDVMSGTRGGVLGFAAREASVMLACIVGDLGCIVGWC